MPGKQQKNDNKSKGQVKPLVAGKESAKVPRWLWPLIITLVAILMRVAIHIQASANDPAYNHIMQDELTYNNWAISFSRGEMPSPLPFAAPPFYSFVLGNLIYRFTGENYIAAYIFNNLLGLLNIYLLFLIGRKAWDRRAGLIAAAIYSFYPSFMMLEMKLMATTLYLALALLSIYWAMLSRDRDRPGAYLAAGLIMGLATITRPTFIFFMPFYILWLLSNVKPVKHWMITALLVAVGFILPVIPVTAVNTIGGKDFVPLTTTGGLNLYMGNYEDANAFYHFPPGIDASSLQALLRDSVKFAEGETGKEMKQSEVSSYFMRKSLDFIRTQPAKWLKLLGWKFRAIMNTFEVGDVWDYYTNREMVSVYYWLGLPFAVFIALGALGIVWTFGSNRWVSLLGFAFLSFFSYMLVFFISTRFRIPMVATCCLFIGGGVTTLAQRKLSTARLMGGIAVGIVTFLLSVAPMSWMPGLGKMFGSHYNAGVIYFDAGEFDKAKAEFLTETEQNPLHGGSYAMLGQTEHRLGDDVTAESYLKKAVALSPDSSLVRATYGAFLLEVGRNVDAEVEFRKAHEIDPGDRYTACLFADVLFRLGRTQEALDVLESIPAGGDNAKDVLALRGTIMRDLGRTGEAADAYRKAIEYDVDDPNLWYFLGLSLKDTDPQSALGAFAKVAELEPEYKGLKLAIGDAWYAQGNYANARDAYIQGLETEPDSYELHHNLALAYGRLSEVDKAAESLAKALELKPDYYQAYYNLANIYIGQGNADAAIINLEKALEIKPDFYQALLNLGTIYAQLQDNNKAREYWGKVITIAPDSQEATIARSNLKALD